MRWQPDFRLVAAGCFAAGLSMMGPAAVALSDNDHSTSRTFFYCGLLIAVFAFITGFAARSVRRRPAPAGMLIELTVIFMALPLALAVPVHLATVSLSWTDAYFEMVSCLTTTGASALPRMHPAGGAPTEAIWSGGIPYALAYWRAQVAWMGGLLFLLAAAEILSPLGVGGFEIADQRQVSVSRMSAALSKSLDGKRRHRGAWRITLCYAGLTAVLWLLMMAAGDPPVDSLISAMSALSTSGITAEGGFSPPSGALPGEIFVCAFMILALSRTPLFSLRWGMERAAALVDREARLAFLLVLAAVGGALFFSHRQLAEARSWQELAEVAESLWGVVFTSVSFLTTTGFQSLHWEEATKLQPRDFVSLSLLGAALIGGGVATTAGGVKLLRVDELLRFCSGELGRLAYPSTVLADKNPVEGARGERTVLACIFAMLFLVLLALLSILLSLSVRGFDEAVVLSISSLTNTGPLANAVLGSGFIHSDLADPAKLLLCAAMVIGRLELLALISLINPGIWGRFKSAEEGGHRPFEQLETRTLRQD